MRPQCFCVFFLNTENLPVNAHAEVNTVFSRNIAWVRTIAGSELTPVF